MELEFQERLDVSSDCLSEDGVLEDRIALFVLRAEFGALVSGKSSLSKRPCN